jgi:hypothetical protein
MGSSEMVAIMIDFVSLDFSKVRVEFNKVFFETLEVLKMFLDFLVIEISFIS